MLKHEDMTVEFNRTNVDTELRLRGRQDTEKFYLEGAMWSDSYGTQFTNKPKPEFNRLWRDINKIIGTVSNMEFNAVISSNSEQATDEGAELLQRRWRNDFMNTEGAKANENAIRECLVCGFGAVKLVSKYEDEENPNPEEQILQFKTINSAITCVFFDAGAVEKDKSDAIYGWELIRVNKHYAEMEYGKGLTSFMNPVYESSTTQLSLNSTKDIYLAHFYEVIEKKLRVYDFTEVGGPILTTGDGIKDQFGDSYTKSDLDDLKEMYEYQTGEQITYDRKKVKYVEYALADGSRYLTKPQKMPFKRIPIIPVYAYWASIYGKEYYCGEVRKRLDAEMFHNMFGSTMMEIMSKPQVEKQEYLPEQIARHASQRASAEVDNVPFLMSDIAYDKNDNPIIGPVGKYTPPQIGTGLAAAGQFLGGQLAQGSTQGQTSLPANTSGEAVRQINERQDDTTLPAVISITHSIRATCLTWIPAAQNLLFNKPRRLRVQEVDGSYSNVSTLEVVALPNGKVGPYKNNPTGRYSVSVKAGESYKSSRAAQRETMERMVNYAGSDTEMGQLMLMNALMLTDGEGGDRMRQIASYKMIDMQLAMGIPLNEQDYSEDEIQYIKNRMQQMRAQQQMAQQNDPVMMQAQAQAQLAEAETIKAQADVMDKQVDVYNAETQRMKVAGDLEAKGIQLSQKQMEMQINAVQSALNNTYQ